MEQPSRRTTTGSAYAASDNIVGTAGDWTGSSLSPGTV